MSSFELYEPRTLDEATALLAQHGDDARIIAGGTAVVLMLKNHLIAPSALVSLGELDGLQYIRTADDGTLRLGAMTTIREIERSPLVMERCPTLARTCRQVANVRVRHAATIGGNLSEADYASDPPAVLVAARARVRVASAKGEREVPLTDWFTDFFETALRPDEVVTEVIVPAQMSTRSAYVKFVSRSSEDRPCLGVAAFLDTDGDVCRELRVAVGAAAATPQEFPAVEAIAAGQRLTPALIQEIAEGYASAIDPIADLRGSAWYRTQLTRVLVRDAITEALAGQPEDQPMELR
jgi:carbon-monoxide dehydrogenase medium subunit